MERGDWIEEWWKFSFQINLLAGPILIIEEKFFRLAQWSAWVAQLVRAPARRAPARRAGDPGSNPGPGENFSLKLLMNWGRLQVIGDTVGDGSRQSLTLWSIRDEEGRRIFSAWINISQRPEDRNWEAYWKWLQLWRGHHNAGGFSRADAVCTEMRQHESWPKFCLQ